MTGPATSSLRLSVPATSTNMLIKFKYWILGVLTLLAFSAAIAHATGYTLPPDIQRGDLIVATSTTQAVRLATGSPGSVLSIVNGVPKYVATSTLGLGGGGTGTVTSVGLSAPTGLSVSGSPVTSNGTLALSLQAGYNIPLTASTTNWNNFFNTPSTQITSGTNLSWSGNTLNGLSNSSIEGLFSGSAPISYGSGAISCPSCVTNAYASSTFQPTISLTTTGSSGAATFSGNVLNIPQYTGGGGGLGAGTATGTPNYVFTNYPNSTGTNFGVNSSTPTAQLTVVGISGSTTPIAIVASSSGLSNLQIGGTNSDFYVANQGVGAQNRGDIEIGSNTGPKGDYNPLTSAYDYFFPFISMGPNAGQHLISSTTAASAGGPGYAYDVTSIGANVFGNATSAQESIGVGDDACANALGFGNSCFSPDAGRGIIAGQSNTVGGNDSMVSGDGNENAIWGAGSLFGANWSNYDSTLGNGAGFALASSSNVTIIGHKDQFPNATTTNALDIDELIWGTNLTPETTLAYAGDGAGQIGIGTDTPIAKLTVEASSTDAAIPEFVVASSSGSSNLTISANGDESITGTTTIAGNIKLGGFLYDTNGTNGNKIILNQGGPNFMAISATSTNGTSNSVLSLGYTASIGTYLTPILTIEDNKDVGIGSTTPSATLTIQGSSGAVPDLIIASSSGTSLFSVSSLGNLNYATATASSLASFDAGKNLQSTILGSNLSFSGNTLSISASPSFTNLTLSGTLAVTGTSTLATTTVAGINILGTFDKSFSLASTTPDYLGNSFSTATYTLPSIWNPYSTTTLVSLFCETDQGTVLLNFQNSLLNCTTSGASSTPTTTLNSRANIQVKIGSESSSPNNLSVTATFHY
jgi:hypothetical protein